MHNRTPCINQPWQAQSNSEKVCNPLFRQSTNHGHTGAFPCKRCYATVQVALYCDLHGHSRKHGTFMYGCEQAPSPQVSHTSLLLHCMHFSAPPVVSYPTGHNRGDSALTTHSLSLCICLARQMELAGCQGTTCEKQCTFRCMYICRPAAAAAVVV